MEHAYPKYVIFDQNLKNLIKIWDKKDPVDEWECFRAEKIKKIQGNVNQILYYKYLLIILCADIFYNWYT